MPRSKVVEGKKPNTFEIDRRFLEFKTLRLELIPECSNLELIGVKYAGDLSIDNQKTIPPYVTAHYSPEITAITRHRWRKTLIDLTVPHIADEFNDIIKGLLKLNDTSYSNYNIPIKYTVKRIVIRDNNTGSRYLFKRYQIDKEWRMLLKSIDGTKVEDFRQKGWFNKVQKAFADVFYVACYRKNQKVLPGEHCLSGTILKAQMSGVSIK